MRVSVCFQSGVRRTVAAAACALSMAISAAGTVTESKLTASDAAANDLFGSSVAIDGGTALVGSPSDNSRGSVYVYTHIDGAWTQQAKITASDAAAGDMFGFSVDHVEGLVAEQVTCRHRKGSGSPHPASGTAR